MPTPIATSNNKSHNKSRWLRRGLPSVLLLGALLALSLKIIVPALLQHYTDALRQSIEEALQTSVALDRLQLSWQGWYPALRVNHLQLLDPQTARSQLSFPSAVLQFDPYYSLLKGRPIVRQLQLNGDHLVIRLPTSDTIAEPDPSILRSLAAWLNNIQNLDLHLAQLVLQDGSGNDLASTALQLRVRSLAEAKQLAITFTPTRYPDKRLQTLLELNGQPLSDTVSGQRWQGRLKSYSGGDEILNSAIELALSIDEFYATLAKLPVPALARLAKTHLESAAPKQLAQWLSGGELNDLNLRYSLHTKNYQIATRFRQLQLSARQNSPAIAGLRGQLRFDQRQGRIDLDSAALTVNWPLLRAPVHIDTLTGSLHWQHAQTQNHWLLSSPALTVANAHLQAKLYGEILFDQTGNPLLDLAVDYQAVDVAHIYRYLPTALLKPKLLAWLDQALVGGQISQGSMVWSGRGVDFPFADDSGRFETRFLVKDMTFNYHPEWPRIEQLAAEIAFSNRSFGVTAVSGHILDVALHRVDARIDELGKSPLIISGQLSGPGENMLQFVRESPLAANVGHYLKDVTSTGQHRLGLDLLIPLQDERSEPVQVAGLLTFTATDLHWPGHQLALQQVNGQLHFTERELAAEDLRLNFRGHPSHLAIRTENNPGDNKSVRFQLRGELDSNALLGDYATAAQPYLNGQSQWDIVLDVAQRDPKQPPRYTLTLTSDLVGSTLNLPPPLAKSAKLSTPLQATLRVAGNQAQLGLDYRPAADIHSQAQIKLNQTQGDWRFHGGELRINAGPAQATEQTGLAVVAKLSHYSLASAISNPPNRPLTLPASWAWLRDLQLQFDELQINRQRFSAVSLDLQQQAETIALRLQGPDLAGTVTLPSAERDTLRADLRRLALKMPAIQDQTARVSTLDPRLIPPLRIAIDDLRLNEHSLGQLELATLPDEQGLQLQELVIHSDNHRLTAQGYWHKSATAQHSRLDMQLYSRELKKTLGSFGYDTELEQAEMVGELSIGWPDALPRFSLAALEGRLSLHIGNGQLPQLDPGLGRLLGLVNLNQLTRRLSLDFSDIFDTGLVFDSIDGEVRFAAGQAYTEDLIIRGPSADIAITGRLGLKTKDYAQTITVIPQIGTSLAIAGALAGGPAVGAAVLVAGQLLKPGLEQVIAYQYELTGPWAAPQIKRVKDDNPGGGYSKR